MKEKKIYTSPKIEVIDIALENGIVVGSANVSMTGDPYFEPEIEEWTKETETKTDYL